MECNRVSVAQAFHPSYSGGRDQEDPGLKPAQVGSLRDPILKIANTKQLVEWLQQQSTFLASMMPWLQTPVLETNKQTKKTKETGI
jgi:hypothetical protein